MHTPALDMWSVGAGMAGQIMSSVPHPVSVLRGRQACAWSCAPRRIPTPSQAAIPLLCWPVKFMKADLHFEALAAAGAAASFD